MKHSKTRKKFQETKERHCKIKSIHFYYTQNLKQNSFIQGKILTGVNKFINRFNGNFSIIMLELIILSSSNTLINSHIAPENVFETEN